jgi:hypothetical protein
MEKNSKIHFYRVIDTSCKKCNYNLKNFYVQDKLSYGIFQMVFVFHQTLFAIVVQALVLILEQEARKIH